MKESPIQTAIRVECSTGDTRLFRQQAGQFWAGDAVTLTDGSVLIRHPRRVTVGFEGWPDLGGWTTVEVTPEMVGQRIAIAVQVEVKRDSGGNKRKRQVEFIAFALARGVRAGFAKSVAEAKRIISGIA